MFDHLLIPLDGSRLAEAVLPIATELASRFDSRLTLLSVTRPPYVAVDMSGYAYVDVIGELRDQAYAEAEEYLRKRQRELQQQGHKVEIQLVEGEPVAEMILRFVANSDVDMIVMSTHGRSGISRWVYGSVADKVLQHASVPVLLVRAKEEDFEWQQSGHELTAAQ